MKKQPKVYVVRVFVDEKGKYGNPVGIIIDEKNIIDDKDRQLIAKNLNFSETVFIDNLDRGKVSIFNPLQKVKFTGHAMLGTTWFIKKIKKINIKRLIWIKASLNILSPWNFIQLNNPQQVEDIKQITDYKHTFVWAWKDEKEGIIRARTFAPDWGIPEDEANGSGAMQLSAKLNRPIKILHGKGSEIYAKPINNKIVQVGGRCTFD